MAIPHGWQTRYRAALRRERARDRLVDEETDLLECLGGSFDETSARLAERCWTWRRGSTPGEAPWLVRGVDGGTEAVLDAARAPLAALAATPLTHDAWLLAARAASGPGPDAALRALRATRPADGAAARHVELLELELRARLPESGDSESRDLLARALAAFEATAARGTQLRALDVLHRVAARSDDAANAVFSEAVARALLSIGRVAQRRDRGVDFGDFVGELLAGTAAEEQLARLTVGERRRGQRYAVLAGALAATHPAWFDDAYEAMRRDDPESLLVASLVEGMALSGAPLAPFAQRLAAAALHAPPVMRRAATTALGAALPSPAAREALDTLSRDPEAEVRRLAAGAADAPLLGALVLDPEPSVRAAAAQQLFLLGPVDPPIIDALWKDFARGSARLKSGAARALAVGGYAAGSPGSGAEFGAALVAEVSSDPSAGRALAVWATPEDAWELLYRGALTDRDWLRALGHAVSDGWPGLMPSPPERRDDFERHAILSLRDDELLPAAATCLAVQAADRVLRALFGGATSLDDGEATVVSTLAAGARQRHPRLGELLLARADDPQLDLDGRGVALVGGAQLAAPETTARARIEALLDGPLADAADVALAHLARPVAPTA